MVAIDRDDISAFRPSYQGWKHDDNIVPLVEGLSLLDLPIRDGNPRSPPRIAHRICRF